MVNGSLFESVALQSRLMVQDGRGLMADVKYRYGKGLAPAILSRFV